MSELTGDNKNRAVQNADYKLPDGWGYAGFWDRAFAFILDGILLLLIIFLIAGPLLVLIYQREYTNNMDFLTLMDLPFIGYYLLLLFADENYFSPDAVHVIAGWGIPSAYFLWYWIYKGTTPGKMLIPGMKIVDSATGKPPPAARCILRYCAYFISAIPFSLGFFWIAFDKKKQGWHDKLAGTVVLAPENQHINPWLNDKIEFIFGKKS